MLRVCRSVITTTITINHHRHSSLITITITITITGPCFRMRLRLITTRWLIAPVSPGRNGCEIHETLQPVAARSTRTRSKAGAGRFLWACGRLWPSSSPIRTQKKRV